MAHSTAATPTTPSQPSPRFRTSNDLIREHVRAAREHVDAQNSRIRNPDSRSHTPDPLSAPDTLLLLPQTPIALTAQPAPQPLTPTSRILVNQGSNINFGARPVKILAQVAPELAPPTPTPANEIVEAQPVVTDLLHSTKQKSLAASPPAPLSKDAPRPGPPTPPKRNIELATQPIREDQAAAKKDRLPHHHSEPLAATQPLEQFHRRAIVGATIEKESEATPLQADRKTLPHRQSASLVAVSKLKSNLSMQSLGASTIEEYEEKSVGETSPTVRNTSVFADSSSARHLNVALAADPHVTQGSLSTRVGGRRPPNLNIDVVREAEARGSMTSLHDLIRRALRLASNLERGDTSSKFGHEWLNGGTEKHGSMLHPPTRTSPTPVRSFFSDPRTPRAASAMDEKSQAKLTRRRCCGMPVWLFVVLLVLLLLIIVAAVLIPIFLVVMARRSGASMTASSSASLACRAQLTCLNGGTNILSSDNICWCLCTNGFSGTTCGVRSGVDCTTMSTDGISNATVGTAIPSLLNNSLTSYNLNLDASLVLSLFNSANLSCTSENALVTFNGLSARALKQPVVLRPHPNSKLAAAAPPSFMPRAMVPRQNAATMNGIVFAMSTSTLNVNTLSAMPSSVATATSSAPSSSSSFTSSAIPHDPETLNFARTAVLYIFQKTSSFGTANTALQNLEAVLSPASVSRGAIIDAGNGWIVDLSSKTLSKS